MVTSAVDDPYGAVAETLAEFRVAEPDLLPPFAGGAVGFFGYDLVRTVEPLGPPNPDPLGLPDLALMVCELMLAFDHLRHEVTVLGYAFAGEDAAIDDAYDRAVELIDEAREALRGPVPPPPRAAGARGRRAGARLVRPRRCRGPVAVEPLAASTSRPTSPGSSSTRTPATPSRSSPRSGSAPRRRSRRSRSTAGCEP